MRTKPTAIRVIIRDDDRKVSKCRTVFDTTFESVLDLLYGAIDKAVTPLPTPSSPPETQPTEQKPPLFSAESPTPSAE